MMPETTKVKLGYIPIVESAAMIIAKEKGFFAKYGMTEVEVSKQANWASAKDNVTIGSQGGGIDGGQWQMPMPHLITEGIITNGNKVPMYGLTVRQNIALAVDEVMKGYSDSERRQIVNEHIDLVGLSPAADKLPNQLSGGMKQRVAIPRALAIRPKLLLLDEPFGALDALTRGNLQEQLMQICTRYQITAVMVTHDVDEAVFLSDRIVMLTNGPGSKRLTVFENVYLAIDSVYPGCCLIKYLPYLVFSWF